jgi:hypothetical protein
MEKQMEDGSARSAVLGQKAHSRAETEKIRVRGKDVEVPSVRIDGRTVVVKGRWLKVAAIKEHEFIPGDLIPDRDRFLEDIRKSGTKADIFTFCEPIDEPNPRSPFTFEFDNVAVAVTKDFEAWWNGLPQESRKNVRRAAKRGVSVDVVRLSDDVVKGIKTLYDESPVRQGRRFWHYGKDLSRVRLENETYLERSEFLGAYFEGELIGYMKWVYVGNVARMMQIISANAHFDKRPTNAMIAKAVEICHQKGIHYLVYGKFKIGNKTVDQLAEFKQRNGFIQMNFPAYYVPLTIKGRLALKLRLHLGLHELLPAPVINSLWKIRARVLGLTNRISRAQS